METDLEIEIRDEGPDDVAAIHAIHTLAFGREQEGNLVDALRQNGAARLSLVATANEQIVGHILYSPITIGGSFEGAALAPLAVHPGCQGKGAGSKLVEAGSDRLKREGCPYIIVLGHAEYYPRFGFKPASSTYAVSCEWQVPDDVFMLLVLDEARMRNVSGKSQYRPEFSTPQSRSAPSDDR
jgi:putative acetyltransferase